MYGADTNVIVRLVVADDLAQQEAVRARLASILASGHLVLITQVVIAELVWVLASAYGYRREQIASVVKALVETPPFEVEGRSDVLHALRLYRGGSADLSDYLILASCSSRGALPLLTFDRKLVREAGCELP